MNDQVVSKRTPPPAPLTKDQRKQLIQNGERAIDLLKAAANERMVLMGQIEDLTTQLHVAAGWSTMRDRVNTALMFVTFVGVVILLLVEAGRVAL